MIARLSLSCCSMNVTYTGEVLPLLPLLEKFQALSCKSSKLQLGKARWALRGPPNWVLHFIDFLLATSGYELLHVKSQQCIYKMKVLSIHLGWIKYKLKAVISDKFPVLKFNQIASWILKIQRYLLKSLKC